MKTTKSKTKAATLADLSVSELRDAAVTQQTIIDSAKEKMDAIQAELRNRFEPVLRDALAQQDKQYGQHTFDADGVKLTAEVKATVKWDSVALEKIAANLPWETVSRVFKIEFSVPEKNFKVISDQALLGKLVEARTVKYSDAKVIFS
jgi:hypothetical protein